MEITPVTPAVRTAKVRTTKAAEPKSSKKAAPAATPAKVAAAPRKRKTLAVKTVAPAPADLADMIATAAYYLAEQRQFAPGYELQDWLTAEQQVLTTATSN